MSLDLPSLLRLFGGMRRAPTNQSTNQSIPRSTGFLSHELGRLIDYRTVLHDRPINQSINQPSKSSLFDHVQQTKSNLYPSINQSINQSYTCRFIPNYQQSINHYNARAFCVKWSVDGLTCVVASQDNQLHLYETIDALVEKESIDQSINQSSFQPFKQIAARHVGWSIIDVSYSPNSEFVAYSTWSPYIQLCNVHGSYELHESLDMQPGGSRICFFAIDFSPSGREVLGGASDGAWYLYDIERKQRTVCVSGHSDDINSVCFVDASGDVLLTGSDDRTIRVWDLRVCSNSGVTAHGRYDTQPVGSFLGHAEGITCVTSAQDGRLIASNGKDQCLKVWDLRSTRSASDADDYEREPRSDYDYRYGNFAPHNQSTTTHAFDTSLATMRGHRIAETLVRCHFSPAFTTANRYLYTGSYRGSVFIYDCLTGDVVTKLDGHSATVRDCSWHPYEPIMLTASWDNTVGLWTYSGELQTFDQSTNLSNDPAAALFESDDDDDYMPQDDEEDDEDDDDQSINQSDEAMNDASQGRHQHDQDDGKDIDEEDEDEDEDEEDDDEAEYEIDVDDETFNQTVMSLLADAMMNRIDPMQLIQRMDQNEDIDEKNQDDDSDEPSK